MDFSSIDIDLVITVQSFTPSSSTLNVQNTIVDGDKAVGFDAGTSCIVRIILIVFVPTTCQDGRSSSIYLEIAVGGNTFVGSTRHIYIDDTTSDDDGIIASDTVARGRINKNIGLRKDTYIIITADACFTIAVHLQITFSTEDQLTFTEETSFHILIIDGICILCAVGEVVVRTLFQHDECTFLTLIVDSCSVGIRYLHSVEDNSLFFRTVQFEKTVIRRTGQHILDNFSCLICGNDIITVNLYDTTIVSLYGGCSGRAESDGDSAGERSVFNIVIIVFVNGQSF